MTPKPASPYGASKLMGEAYCWAYAQSYGLNALSLRFTNIYGPHSLRKGSVVAAFMRRILDGRPVVIYGDGSQIRDMVYIDDLVSGIMQAIKADVHGVYQLGSGEPTSILELVDALRTVTGYPFEVHHEPARPGEVKDTYGDISLAREALGYAPSHDLLDGLSRTWEWFFSQRDRIQVS